MSRHRSYGKMSKSAKKRNVLKRFERVDVLKKLGKWKEGDRQKLQDSLKRLSPNICIINQQRSLSISASSVRKLVKLILEKYKIRCEEVAIHFVTSSMISKLHQEFFQDPTTTDCITFPIDDPYSKKEKCLYLGEIFICPAYAKNYSASHGNNVYEELSLYAVHGILHLLGYDDLIPAKKQVMRRHEKQCLKLLHQQKALIRPAS